MGRWGGAWGLAVCSGCLVESWSALSSLAIYPAVTKNARPPCSTYVQRGVLSQAAVTSSIQARMFIFWSLEVAIALCCIIHKLVRPLASRNGQTERWKDAKIHGMCAKVPSLVLRLTFQKVGAATCALAACVQAENRSCVHRHTGKRARQAPGTFGHSPTDGHPQDFFPVRGAQEFGVTSS